jgi:hypothetical protein
MIELDVASVECKILSEAKQTMLDELDESHARRRLAWILPRTRVH